MRQRNFLRLLGAAMGVGLAGQLVRPAARALADQIGPNTTETGNLYVPNGLVGIGTLEPLGQLHLSSPGQPSFLMGMTGGNYPNQQLGQIIYDAGAAVPGGGWVFQRMTDSGAFSANLVTVVQTSGSVGIGTISPAALLDVNGNARVAGSLGIGTATPDGQLHLSNLGQPTFLMGMTGGNYQGQHLGQIVFDSGGAVPGGGWVFQRMTDAGAFSANLVTIVQSNGSIGIGTLSPGALLDVNGNARIGGNLGIGTSAPLSQLHLSSAGQPALTMGNSTGNTGQQMGRIVYDGGGAIQGGGWQFQRMTDTGGFVTGLVTITQKTGYVGIGTSAPAAPLDVSGAIAVGGATAIDATGTAMRAYYS